MTKCGFCGEEFDSMIGKLLHQESCDEVPRTKSRDDTNKNAEEVE